MFISNNIVDNMVVYNLTEKRYIVDNMVVYNLTEK